MQNIVLTMAECLASERIGFIKAGYWYFAIFNCISLKFMCFKNWSFFRVDITEN